MMATASLSAIAATKIGEIARRAPVRVGPSTPLGECVARLCEHGRGAVVVEEAGRPVGIFTERDLMLRVDHGKPGWWEGPVEPVMTRSPRTARADQTIEEVLNLMLAGNYRHLPIVDPDGGLAGIVSVRDVLVHIVGFFPADFVNLPPDPDHEASQPDGG
jgi:CBS domain-containing protein